MHELIEETRRVLQASVPSTYDALARVVSEQKKTHVDRPTFLQNIKKAAGNDHAFLDLLLVALSTQKRLREKEDPHAAKRTGAIGAQQTPKPV